MDINELQFLSNPFTYVGAEEDGVHFSWEHFSTIAYEEMDLEALDDYVHVTVTDIPDEDTLNVGDYMEHLRIVLNEETLTVGDYMEPLRTGLSPEEISARMEPYSSLSGAPSDDRQCCICLDDCHDGSGKELGKLDCTHEFHYACISVWLLQRNSCPLCRRTGLAGEESTIGSVFNLF